MKEDRDHQKFEDDYYLNALFWQVQSRKSLFVSNYAMIGVLHWTPKSNGQCSNKFHRLLKIAFCPCRVFFHEFFMSWMILFQSLWISMNFHLIKTVSLRAYRTASCEIDDVVHQITYWQFSYPLLSKTCQFFLALLLTDLSIQLHFSIHPA